jgi:hypothetical protein
VFYNDYIDKQFSKLVLIGIQNKNQINFYRSTNGFKKASGFVALTQNIPLDKAQLLLKSIILAAPYSKNRFNN